MDDSDILWWLYRALDDYANRIMADGALPDGATVTVGASAAQAVA